jgi:hypothetical protein
MDLTFLSLYMHLYLNADNNNIGDLGCKYLSQAMLPHITEIALSKSEFTQIIIKLLVKEFFTLQRLIGVH